MSLTAVNTAKISIKYKSKASQIVKLSSHSDSATAVHYARKHI